MPFNQELELNFKQLMVGKGGLAPLLGANTRASPLNFTYQKLPNSMLLQWRTWFVGQRTLRHLTIHHSPDLQRVRIFKFIRQSGIRPILVRDWPHKTERGPCADRSRTTVRGRGVWTTMDHRVTHFNSGGESIEKQAAGL